SILSLPPDCSVTPSSPSSTGNLERMLREHGPRAVRFLGIGGAAAALDLLIVAFLVQILGAGVLAAYCLSSAICLTLVFLGNKYWTFRDRARAGRRQVGLFLAVTLTGTAANVAIAYGLHRLGLFYLL